MVGRPAGQPAWRAVPDNNITTLWLHLASWNLLDFQLSWESKMEPSVAKKEDCNPKIIWNVLESSFSHFYLQLIFSFSWKRIILEWVVRTRFCVGGMVMWKYSRFKPLEFELWLTLSLLEALPVILYLMSLVLAQPTGISQEKKILLSVNNSQKILWVFPPTTYYSFFANLWTAQILFLRLTFSVRSLWPAA